MFLGAKLNFSTDSLPPYLSCFVLELLEHFAGQAAGRVAVLGRGACLFTPDDDAFHRAFHRRTLARVRQCRTLLVVCNTQTQLTFLPPCVMLTPCVILTPCVV